MIHRITIKLELSGKSRLISNFILAASPTFSGSNEPSNSPSRSWKSLRFGKWCLSLHSQLVFQRTLILSLIDMICQTDQDWNRDVFAWESSIKSSINNRPHPNFYMHEILNTISQILRLSKTKIHSIIVSTEITPFGSHCLFKKS